MLVYVQILQYNCKHKRDERLFINALSDATGMTVTYVKNTSRLTVSSLRDQLKKNGVWYRSGSRKSELVTLLVNSIAPENESLEVSKVN